VVGSSSRASSSGRWRPRQPQCPRPVVEVADVRRHHEVGRHRGAAVLAQHLGLAAVVVEQLVGAEAVEVDDLARVSAGQGEPAGSRSQPTVRSAGSRTTSPRPRSAHRPTVAHLEPPPKGGRVSGRSTGRYGSPARWTHATARRPVAPYRSATFSTRARACSRTPVSSGTKPGDRQGSAWCRPRRRQDLGCSVVSHGGGEDVPVPRFTRSRPRGAGR